MKTYRDLTAAYLKRNYRGLDKIAKSIGRDYFSFEPMPVWNKIFEDQKIALKENSELFEYQLTRI